MNRSGPAARGRLRWVIKVGGSLSKSEQLAPALKEIDNLAGKGFKLLVAPGGGEYADFIRLHSSRRRLDSRTAHLQAILSVRQYGLELASRLKRGVAVFSAREATLALGAGKTPVFLPDEGVLDVVKAPVGWATTSDTIAVAILARMRFGGLILLKSVDGVEQEGALAPRATATAAARAGVVDKVFPKVVRKQWDLFILNGAKPGLLSELLLSGHCHGTRLTAP